MSIARNKERDLTTGPLVPKIILFALPLMATGILQLMFNAADLIIVGRFAPNGQEDIGAIGGTGPLINLVINLFIGLSVGTSVFTDRYIGAGDREKTSQTVHTSMAVALIGGIVCFILGFFFARTFLSWMGTIDEFLDLSTRYMQDPQSEEILNLIFKSLSFDFSQTCSNILSGSCLRDMMRPIMSGNRNTVSSQMRSWGRSVPKRLQKINEDLEKMDSN